jgi:ketosteroid isomerase-like protein
LARVAAELEIRNVLARVAQHYDSNEEEPYIRLFAEDAVWEMADNPRTGQIGSVRQGRAEIAEGLRERHQAAQADGKARMHFVATSAVTVSGDEASATSYFQLLLLDHAGVNLQSAGRYLDSMRRTDDGWKLAARVIWFG